MVLDLGVGCVRLDCLNALLGARLRLVSLAGGDDLAIGGLEVEPEFSGVVLADFRNAVTRPQKMIVSKLSCQRFHRLPSRICGASLGLWIH
jgi:hypothetical protein